MSGLAVGATNLDLAHVSRRRVLGVVGVVGAAAAVASVPAWHRGAAESGAAPAEVLVASTFTGLVGRTFTLDLDEATSVPLRLAAVEGLAGAGVAERAFLLRFDGPVAATQGGQVGHLHGPSLPASPLLVVPSGLPDARGQAWTVTVVGAPV
jgi:hypothetical protein